MKIKRFIANNMRQALLCVRKEQGPDAVILSNRRVEGGIEVVAAIDYDESLMLPPPQAANSSQAATSIVEDATVEASAGFQEPLASSNEEALLFGDIDDPAPTGNSAFNDSRTTGAFESDSNDIRVSNVPVEESLFTEPAVSDAPIIEEGPFSNATDGTSWSRESALGAIREEINGMRSLLTDQLSSMAWKDEVRRDPATVNVLRRYASMGIDEDIARSIAERLSDAAVDGSSEGSSSLELATHGLATSVPLLDETILDHGGVVAVIGPTGVGKTTSIAKIAARYALKHGRDQVALVSTDSFRIGAQEQLATFAQILDVPVHRVTDKQELGTLLRSLADKRLVLIDTAGVSQRVEGLAKHLSAFDSGDVKIHTYLALAANAHSQTLDEVIRKFGCVPLDGCILTKIDEAACLGAALSAIIRHRTPIAFFANGQRVPEDLHTAAGRSVGLVNYATRLMHESGQHVSEEFMARHYGEVRTHACA